MKNDVQSGWELITTRRCILAGSSTSIKLRHHTRNVHITKKHVQARYCDIASLTVSNIRIYFPLIFIPEYLVKSSLNLRNDGVKGPGNGRWRRIVERELTTSQLFLRTWERNNNNNKKNNIVTRRHSASLMAFRFIALLGLYLSLFFHPYSIKKRIFFFAFFTVRIV